MAENAFKWTPTAIRQYRDKPGYDVVYMTPDQYLALSPPAADDPAHNEKLASIKDQVGKGNAVDKIPHLDVKVGKGGNAEVVDQDGRHRALVALEQGIKRIPVSIKRTSGEEPIASLKGLGTDQTPVNYSKFKRVPKTWTEIVQGEKYQALNPDERADLRKKYAEQVIAPMIPEKQREKATASWLKNMENAAETYSPVGTPEENRLAGIGQGMTNLARGAGQRLGLLNQSDIAAARAKDAPLLATPEGREGQIFGQIGAALPTAAIPGGSTVIGGAAIGGGMGALEPTVEGESTLGNIGKGAAFGGALSGIARFIPSVVKHGLIDPFTKAGQERIALSSIGRFAQNPDWLNLARNAVKEIIPGSPLSLAEITRDPGIAQLQRSGPSAAPEIANELATARTQRVAAKQKALEPLRGAPGEYEKLLADREKNAKQMYDVAFKKGIDTSQLSKADVARNLRNLQGSDTAGNPNNVYFQRAMQEGASLARAEGHTLRGDPRINFADDPKSLLVNMHYGKQILGDMIERAKAQGQGSEARILTGTMEKVDTVLRKLSPEYEVARNAYEQASKPINRLEVGRYLHQKLIPALTEYGGERLKPTQFAEALRDMDALARKATGSEASKAVDVLDPADVRMLENMKKEMGGEMWAQEAGAVKGSPTAQYLTGKNLLSSVAGPLGLPQGFTSTVLADALANRWTSLLMKPAEGKVAERIGEILANPGSLRQQPAASGIPLSKIADFALPVTAGVAGQRVGGE